ncbi:MAG TPA: amidohydrolase, partial [Aquihabitans sp.]|nr:amidohydrolase [Aquihabitans sp.]
MFDTIPGLLPDLQALYEDLHAHPELSFAEHRTAAILAERLAALGYEVTTDVGRTGVVATLDNGDGPLVLLRADIDALPVEEATGLPYASTVRAPGADGAEVPVAHACGHDMHATWLIGVATLFARHREAWRGRLLLVVQPAEEIAAGAAAMIDDDLFERFGRPDVALGQHVAPAPAGWVLYRSGPVMAATDALRVVLHGRGGHGSNPQSTIDPVVMAASTVLKLQTVVSRTVAPSDTAVVTVGTMHAGTKENVIADHAELGLSIRTFDPAVRDRILKAVERIVHGEAASCGATTPPEVTTTSSFPATINDPGATDAVAAAFRAHFGPERAMEGPAVTGSEDFGAFATAGGFPSSFWFVGGTDPDL